MKLPQKVTRKRMRIILTTVIVVAILTSVGNRYNITLLNTISDVLTYPISKIVMFTKYNISDFFTNFTDVEEIRHQNELILEENARLTYENSILYQLEEENIHLKELLELKNRYEEYPSEAANIIGKDPGNWYKIFTIDKGLISGVNKNDIILANGALVGYINDISPLTATVLPIIDDRSYVSIQIVRSGDNGIMTGELELTNKGLVSVEVDITSDIVPGDQIITSYLSDIFPPGIPVGEVIEIMPDNDGLSKKALVSPIVNFDTLKSVLIIKKGEEE
ncbi:MAG: rod shape-determining protein MreC [Epulopiscium sp. Nuni2H_MBin003]|nr:MAG: rod shape-determining protein MreC [Epulopiscium sp. Nuni2H_MBin003]